MMAATMMTAKNPRTINGIQAMAMWCTHWPQPEYAMDHLDAWRCSVFRNEGPILSSVLIRSAMTLTEDLWRDRGLPTDGWLTFVDTRKVRSANPGACFKLAGWRHDRSWSHRYLVRLRAPLATRELVGE